MSDQPSNASARARNCAQLLSMDAEILARSRETIAISLALLRRTAVTTFLGGSAQPAPRRGRNQSCTLRAERCRMEVEHRLPRAKVHKTVEKNAPEQSELNSEPL